MKMYPFLKTAVIVLLVLLIEACATYSPQYVEKSTSLVPLEQQDSLLHTFYIAGGYGDIGRRSSELAIKLLDSSLNNAPKESTLIFTGDNISAQEEAWDLDKELLEQQIHLAKNFKGNTIFLPGNNEWKSFKSGNVEKIEDVVKDLERENINFFPENACPIEHLVINDQLDLIVLDSKWFISNWSRVEDINKKCTDIKTRRRFLEELEGYINDGQDKNIIIAMHHPIFSNGKYAGKESLKSHITPLPVLGTMMNGISKLGAFSPDLLDSRRYNYLRILVSALAQASNRITIVSGHEESLQYLTGGGIHQIIGGSLTKKTPTKIGSDNITTIGGSLGYEGKFTHGDIGFAKLEYFVDGSSKVSFVSGSSPINSMKVLPKLFKDSVTKSFNTVTDKTMKKAVLDDPEKLNKSGFYKY